MCLILSTSFDTLGKGHIRKSAACAAVGMTVPTIERRTVVQFSRSKETDPGGELGGDVPIPH